MNHTDLDSFRRQLREACGQAGVLTEERARAVLSATLLAEPAITAGTAVDLRTETRDALLAITLRLPQPVPQHERNLLPLLPDPGDGDTLTWHLATGAIPAAVPGPDEQATREEMLALVAHTDALAQQQRRLKHELAETNSGVLAMFTELERRDEELRRAHGVIFRELEDALRPPPPAVPGLELGVHYSPADPDSPTGGDLYDWFTLPSGEVHITLVDAVGHGVTSTRQAITVTHAIRTLALEGHPFADLVARTSNALTPIDPTLMATVLLVRITPATGRVRLANGSHPPPVLITTTGHTRLLATRSPGRGVGFPRPGTPDLVHHTLDAGDTLLLYTDGLVESRKNYDEGESRLLTLARTHAHRPTIGIPRELTGQMHDVVLHIDDTVVMAIRRTP
ncbi:PP2C family protein-serine/threonine phosphatase [Amycolatopsis sp. 195334CR]|uniref:PP2C family protein-serine/threonine phosphatase n=1 Tax=Amycolatopsis sp. 195334CR TaxID=2814588 RepID=UPI001A90289A|nr:PP2C family protein-serine/threonine phosphatase [Amycolatopsis sp. 195334CR]MBN6033700.1 serine/threonine-protein phosphatase [Amycolatopsis sp. 195334CR]